MLALCCAQAAAAGFDTPDAATEARRVTTDSTITTRDADAGDGAGFSRDAAQTAPATSSSSADVPHGGGSNRASHARRTNLGWQSLLPGSIQ